MVIHVAVWNVVDIVVVVVAHTAAAAVDAAAVSLLRPETEDQVERSHTAMAPTVLAMVIMNTQNFCGCRLHSCCRYCRCCWCVTNEAGL